MEGAAQSEHSVTTREVARLSSIMGRPQSGKLHELVPKIFTKHTRVEESAEAAFRQFLAGDNSAFGHLFERFNAKLFRYCYKIVRDHSVAEDLTEDMWLKLIEHRTKLNEKENVLAFLYRVLHNLTLNYLGRSQSVKRMPIEHANEAAADEAGNDIEEMILECMEHLAPESKELLILHYYSGFSFKEIAEAWEMEPEAIWTRATRARQQLKGFVESRMKSL